MASGQGPTTIRRRLRAELRSLRLANHLSVEDVTSAVEWSTSKLIRIENGQVGVSVSDLTALLSIYGVHDTERVEELKRLARATRQRTWWGRFQRYIPPPYLEFIGAESDAGEISSYSPTTVPGLLQTEAYAVALDQATVLEEMSPEVAQARVQVRMLRQRDVLQREQPPQLTAMLDEAVLRRPVGGEATMRGQLDHLIAMADRPGVTIIVVPLQAGPHPGLLAGFSLMGYGDPHSDDVVCLDDGPGLVVLRDKPEVVAAYRRVVRRLVEIGLHGVDARQLMYDVRESYKLA